MKRTFLKSKLHGAIVTKDHLNYEGSLGVDENLMKAADLFPYERVEVYNVSNGERFATYLIKEEQGSGIVAVYGAAAHKAKAGDKVIIASYAIIDQDEIDFYVPKVVLLDGRNGIVEIR